MTKERRETAKLTGTEKRMEQRASVSLGSGIVIVPRRGLG
jgi:hypothetical protein